MKGTSAIRQVSKGDLIKRVTDITGLKARDVDWIINEFTHQMASDITNGERVQIHGLGSFDTLPVKARTGRHPGTGAAIEIPAGKRVRFRPASAIKGS